MRSISEYIQHKPILRDRVLDHGELNRLSRACGLTPQEARSELRRLGYALTTNNHGIAIWTRPDGYSAQHNYPKQSQRYSRENNMLP